MRIALVHKSLADMTMGGIARLYRELATVYRSLGHYVTTVSGFPCAWSRPHLVVPSPPLSPARHDPAPYNRAADQVLAGLDVDVAECSTWGFELDAYAARALGPRALVVARCEHSCLEKGAAHLAPAERALLEHADLRIAVSDFAAASMLRAHPGVRIDAVVHNGVDRSRFHPGVRGSLAALCRRHLVHVNPHGQVVPAAAVPPADRARLDAALDEFLANDRLPVLLWVGRVALKKRWDRLEAVVRALGHRARFVVLLGHSPADCPVAVSAGRSLVFLQDVTEGELPGLYCVADFLLSTSTREGFGLAVAEAAASGTPVLLPRELSAPREYLDSGAYRAYGSVDDLGRLLSQSRAATGDAAVALPGLPGWQEVALATLALYRRAGAPG